MTTPFYGPLRGYVSTLSVTELGPVGTIVDISGTEYFIKPENWVGDEDPDIGMIVDFSARASAKGYVAHGISPSWSDTLCPPGYSATKIEMADADRRAERARQHINRLRQWVLDDHLSPEQAILQLWGLEPPVGMVIPEHANAADQQFFHFISHNRSPKSNHETSRRLCRAFCLNYAALIGFMRGSISYRVALERTHAQRKQEHRENKNQQQTQALAPDAVAISEANQQEQGNFAVRLFSKINPF